MNLNYFKEFIVLADTRNYWEASERLFLNQSTLSKHIKAMETELGVPLFDRTTRRVTLTEFGQTLLPYARAIAELQVEYSTALVQKQNQSMGVVNLGSVSSMKQYHITDLVSEYQAAFPDYNIHVLENDSQYLKQMLLSKKCELAFLRDSEESTKGKDPLVHIPYSTDHLVAVMEQHNPLAQKEALSLKDLVQEKLCFIKKHTILYNLCYKVCQEAGFVPNIVYDSHYMGSIFDMIVKSGCVGLLTNMHVEHIRARHADGPMIIRPIEPRITTQVSLCYLANEPLSEGAAAFVEFFKGRVSH